MSFILFHSLFFQEQEENKSATSWPEFYIDQLNSMAAVSNSMNFIYSLDGKVTKYFQKKQHLLFFLRLFILLI